MAKFAQVGYGHDGRGVGQEELGYTYVVNDNVRTGDVIYPTVIHYANGKPFQTTGRVNNTFKDLDTRSNSPLMEKTNELKDAVQDQLSTKGVNEDELTKVVKASDIVNEKGKQVMRISKDGHSIASPTAGQFKDALREANSKLYKESYQQKVIEKSEERKAEKQRQKGETFDSYSKQFMGD